MIETWLDYSPQDLLLFSEEVYRRLFVRANAAAGPWAVAATPLFVTALWAARWSAAAPLVTLAAGWAGAALALLPLYGEVNWAVAWVAPLFWAQAAARALAAAKARGRTAPPVSPAAKMAMAAAAVAALAHPLAGLAAGRTPEALQLFGVAPDPTALATLATVALLRNGSGAPAALAALPLLWCLASAGTLLALGATVEGTGLLAAAAVLTGLGLTRSPREV